jgi:hypothetical protein
MDDEIRGTEDGTQFARGITGPAGKYTEPVKTHLDERAFMDLLRLCHDKNTTPGELLRGALYLVLYQTTPEQVAADRQRELLKPLADNLGALG